MKLLNNNPIGLSALALILCMNSCKPKNVGSAVSGDAAAKTYVAPGKYDEYYNFVSGGFSGQLAVYGIPSGRVLRLIPFFSLDPEKGWDYCEETKPIHLIPRCHGTICIMWPCRKQRVLLMAVGFLLTVTTPRVWLG